MEVPASRAMPCMVRFAAPWLGSSRAQASRIAITRSWPRDCLGARWGAAGEGMDSVMVSEMSGGAYYGVERGVQS
ncbi:hypothetical protein PPC_4661 [Pseudomonas protegens Cab57]|nr:hypothetical protein PPC_4661 [Pseudomonas protegens Cab57]